MKRKRIGEVLVDAGLITREQLENALSLQKGKNKRLGKVLIEFGYVDETQVALALARQLSLPTADCRDFKVPGDVLALISKEMAEKKIVLPIEVKDNYLVLAMADPMDWQTIHEVEFTTGQKISVVVSSESSILDAIEKNYGSAEKTWDLLKEIPTYARVEFLQGTVGTEDEVNVQALYKLSEAPPVVKLVTMVLVDAVTSRASDVHIEPQEKYVQVRYRVDGDLRNVLKFPKHIQDSVVSRVKIISNLDITNRRLPQDGRSLLRLEDKNIDLRISTLPSVYGEKIVIRLLDRTTGIMPLSRLGVSEKILKPLVELMSQPQGMIIVTGPTGSGKSTTLYAMLQQLQTETENIVTIEDPVEYNLKGITQVGVNEPIGLTFASVLRSILRQDPDIIMVGEIRDLDTAEIAARSALTGHLVLSTVHTNDTVATVTRLLNLGLEPFLITSAVSGILAQRLIRRICEKCKVPAEPPEELVKELPPLKAYYRGEGCRECQFTGYTGRVGVYEFLRLDKKLRRLIARGASEDELWEAAREAGTVPLFEDAWEKVREGLTTVEEVLSKLPYEHAGATVRHVEEGRAPGVLLLDLPEAEAAMAGDALSADGYAPVSIRGEDVVEAAGKANPDLIVIDASRDMEAALRRLRGYIRFAGIPVVALADSMDRGREAEYGGLGVSAFIYRPLDGDRLARMVDHLLRGMG